MRPDGTVNLLDFGVIRVFPSKFVRGVLELYEAVRDADNDKARQAYVSWGFTNLSDEQVEVLGEWARFLYEPLLQTGSARSAKPRIPALARRSPPASMPG